MSGPNGILTSGRRSVASPAQNQCQIDNDQANKKHDKADPQQPWYGDLVKQGEDPLAVLALLPVSRFLESPMPSGFAFCYRVVSTQPDIRRAGGWGNCVVESGRPEDSRPRLNCALIDSHTHRPFRDRLRPGRIREVDMRRDSSGGIGGRGALLTDSGPTGPAASGRGLRSGPSARRRATDLLENWDCFGSQLPIRERADCAGGGANLASRRLERRLRPVSELQRCQRLCYWC